MNGGLVAWGPVIIGGVNWLWGPLCADGNGGPYPFQYYGFGIDGGVAEGSAAMYHEELGRHYLMYTRNPWDQPSYQVVYRFSEEDQSFRSMQLSSSNEADVCEYILVAGRWVSDGAGNPQWYETSNFGHGEFFWAWGRPYLMCRKKLSTEYLCADATCAREDAIPYHERHIYFKELNFMSDGRIHRLYDGHSHRGKDIKYVNLPRPSGTSTPQPSIPSTGEVPPYDPCSLSTP